MPLSSVVGAQSIVKPGVCTSSTRPASPFEGQMIYETDTDVLAIWNGSAWRQLAAATKTGSVLQVVNYNVQVNTNFTTTYVTTNVSTSITPSSTSSKVLVTGTTRNISHNATRDWASFAIYRNSSLVFTIDDYVGDQSTTATAMSMPGVAFNYLDSPATTSSTSYTIYAKTTLGQTWTVTGGSITLMEIAG